MHQGWEPCPSCEGEFDEGDEPCYRCGGAGVLEYTLPVVASEVLSTCPKCGGEAEFRESDKARWCRVCELTFYHAPGWPDILEWMDGGA